MQNSSSNFEIWSAIPTPLYENRRLDKASLSRLIRHHLAHHFDGVLLLGNAGEGPYLLEEDRRELVRIASGESAGALKIAVQVTDNSSLRVLDNMERAKADGADIAVVAEPYYFRNASAESLLNYYEETLANACLPVCCYHLGERAPTVIEPGVIRDVYARPEVVMIKDSSADTIRRDIALEARKARPALRLLNGDEFLCLDYLKAGYNGSLFGGAVFNVEYIRGIGEALANMNFERASTLDDTIRILNWTIYGEKGADWLAGVKYLMMRLEIFSSWTNLLNYRLTEERRAAIDEAFENNRFFHLP